MAWRTAVSDRSERSLQQDVQAFWESFACGEVYAQGEDACAQLRAQAAARYQLEPYIADFARFADGRGRDVLEIGIGMGADHAQWAAAGPRRICGIDLTVRAAQFTKARLYCERRHSTLSVGDAEMLPYADGSFDIVYSWGALHHSADTARAIAEVHRVLRPGGSARIMVYHKWSLVGYALWMRYALLRGRPRMPLSAVYAQYLESPGTKAYTMEEAKQLMSRFRSVTVTPQLSHGDLLEGAVGQRHRGLLLTAAKAVWPRRLLRRFFRNHGLALLIDAVK